MFFPNRQVFRETKTFLSIGLLTLLLVTPLIIQAVPIGGTFSYLTLLLFSCLFLIINFKKLLTSFIKPSLPMYIFFLYLFSFFIGMCISGSETSIFVLKEFIWGCFLFSTLCCANIYFNDVNALKRAETIFTHSAVIIVSMISVFAYLKFLVWKDGYIIDFLIKNQTLTYYPQGTSLVGDINFFSLTLLICSFLSFSLWRKSSAVSTQIIWMAFFILPLGIGFLAGSRRFFLLALTLTPILLFLMAKFDTNLIFKKVISFFIACSLIIGAYYFINGIANISYYVGLFTDLSPTEDTWFSYFNTYSTLISPNQYFGLDARIVRWYYALDLINFNTILTGNGFHYINKFSCYFSSCSAFDYPHAPILSSILYGGAFGLFSYLILISFLIFISVKLLFFSKSYFEWGLVLLSTIIFTSISGNSLLSMPVLFSATIIGYAAYKIEFGETDYAIAKRLFDITVSSTALLFLLPVFILIGLTIFLLIGRPIFFCQLRPGLNSATFKMYKFRTMYNLKDRYGNPLPDKDRLFPLGTFLRSSSLDELPELWNVLIGDMSLVGPRPLLKEYLPLYSHFQLRRHKVRPGITGWAQINGRNALDWSKKFNLDVWYVENMSFWLDIKILAQTFAKVIKREGISTEGEATTKPFRGNN